MCVFPFADCKELCINGTLDPQKFEGKIIVCLRELPFDVSVQEKGYRSAQAGAVGMILRNDDDGDAIVDFPSSCAYWIQRWTFPTWLHRFSQVINLFFFMPPYIYALCLFNFFKQVGYSHLYKLNGCYVFKLIDKDPRDYIQSTVTLLPAKPAPVVANFSSRGPNRISPEILKVRH